MKKSKLYIDGMHCVSCEIMLEKRLKKLKGLKKCRVSHKRGDAEIEHHRDIPLEKLESVVKECGYTLVEKHGVENASEPTVKPDFFEIGLIVMVLGVIAWVLKELEITAYFPEIGNQVGILVALFLGVVASLSTCLALTGGIVMSFGSVVDVDNEYENTMLSRAMPHIYFHMGRIGGFMLLGGLLGVIGGKIAYSISFTGYLTLLIAIVMFYIGFQILGIFPSITKFGFHLPKFLSNKIHDIDGNANALAPVIIGVLTFFLPCGFTQGMQLAAVGSGSFLSGALIMGAFAIGTVPVLFSIGVGSTYAKKEKAHFFKSIIGVVIVFFAIFSFNSGLVLSGSTISLDSLKSGKNVISAEVNDGVQVVKMDVDYRFVQKEFHVKKGIPVRWEINAINTTGCTDEVIIPSLDITSGKLDAGVNVIEFTPTKSGTIPFSCWMGMQGGRFIVE